LCQQWSDEKSHPVTAPTPFLSSLPARCAPRDDLAIRRSIERVVFEVRAEIANVCQQMADKCGQPPP